MHTHKRHRLYNLIRDPVTQIELFNRFLTLILLLHADQSYFASFLRTYPHRNISQRQLKHVFYSVWYHLISIKSTEIFNHLIFLHKRFRQNHYERFTQCSWLHNCSWCLFPRGSCRVLGLLGVGGMGVCVCVCVCVCGECWGIEYQSKLGYWICATVAYEQQN